MPARNRSNPLALAVLVCLAEKPMHPYEVATTLRQRHKHESVRLNYGSLYGVVESLERRGLIAAQETRRSGRLPERTVYALTDTGLIETHDWLTELISTPVRDYPAFQAALSFLPALPPDDVMALLQERARHLESELAQAGADRGGAGQQAPGSPMAGAAVPTAAGSATLRGTPFLISSIISGSPLAAGNTSRRSAAATPP